MKARRHGVELVAKWGKIWKELGGGNQDQNILYEKYIFQ